MTGRPFSNTLLRAWNGPLTSLLRRAPGREGLGQVPADKAPDTITRSVCGFCATGCSLDLHMREGVAVNLSPSPGYPVNLGMACPKGWEALTCLDAPDRATRPLLRQLDGSFRPAGWDEAVGEMVRRFKKIMEAHGPESVAFLSTGQICTEEMALLGCLWKFGMGALHCDSNTRQCMATAHTAYKQSFGFDAPPFTYADFEASDVLVFVGANPCVAHPIKWQRVMRNPHAPQILVVDPRRTETAGAASQHLALRPKSDLSLFYGVARLLLEAGRVDRAFVEAHTVGFGEFADSVRAFTLERVAADTGLAPEELVRFAETIGRGRAVSFWWTMGVNQGHEATRTAQAIINLALMTGNIGRPGTGANSITGQCNAMGSRLYSNVTSLVGGRDWFKPADRAEVAALLGIPVGRIPDQPSLAYDQIVDRVAEGRIKGLWVVATNPSHSWIGRGDGASQGAKGFPDLLKNLDCLVVQDMFATTETARCADILLPAAGWGEKEGTFINSERRIGVVRPVRSAPGEALSDFRIFQLVAHHWGCGEMFRQWSSPEAVFHILKRVSASRPCDITGIRDYRHLEESGGIQWPWPEQGESGAPGPECTPLDPGAPRSAARERRLFEDGRFFTADRRAKFLFDPPRPVAEPTDAEWPLVLLTGRGTSAQWHTNTRTGKSAVLRSLYPARPYVEVNPADARRLGLANGAPVTVESRRGRTMCDVFVTASVAPGQVFIPMHYAEANVLTRPEFDPHSRQPSYKHCAVRLVAAPREQQP